MPTLFTQRLLQFNNPRIQVLNDSGSPLAGAKLYFFGAGLSPITANRKITYKDSSGLLNHAHPIVADAGGNFAAIYLEPSTAYKAVLKTSAGVEVWTEDNLYMGFNMQAGFICVDQAPFNAVGDGVTDDYIPWRDAIVAINANPALILMASDKDYAISASLPPITKSGVKIWGVSVPSYDAGSPVGGTQLTAIGAFSGTMLTVAPIDSAGHQRLWSNEILNIGFNANGKATRGLHVKSVRNGKFKFGAYGAFSLYGAEFNVCGSIDYTKDTQLNDINMVGFMLGSAGGLKMDGVEGLANASMNRVIWDIFTVDGLAVETNCSDTNLYIQGRGYAGGTALRNFYMNAGSIVNEGTRNDNHLLFIGNKGMEAGPGVQPAYSIKVWNNDRLDATPDPVFPAGAKVYWQNESTPIYSGDITTASPGSVVPVGGNGGALTSQVTSLKYWKSLNFLNFELSITITTDGGVATGSINVPMPVACKSGAQGTIVGVETASHLQLIASIQSLSSTLIITNYNGSYPGGNGKVIQVNGQYRIDE